MAELLGTFLHRFVIPLFEGAEVRVGAPLGPKDLKKMLADASALFDSRLLDARERRCRLLVADLQLDAPGPEELRLWIGLHNLLALDHPDVGRVWAREITWTAVELETRAFLMLAPATEVGDIVARHAAVGALIELERDDYHVNTGEGEQSYFGQLPPRAKLTLMGSGVDGLQVETVRWIQTELHPATGRALPLALWSSPLTCFLRPDLAPAGWSPLACAEVLEQRSIARAVVYAWDRHADWLELGAAMVRRLPMFIGAEPSSLEDAALAAADADARPPAALTGAGPKLQSGAFERVVCTLIHLHLLKVLDFDVRIGLGRSARDEAMQLFLALPLTLDLLEPRCGVPLAADDDPRLFRRWREYLQHLDGLVPRALTQRARGIVHQSMSQGSAA